MPATIAHLFTNAVPDATGTQTIFNFGAPGSTTTVAASDIVKPSNWNASHAVTLAPTGQEIIGAFSNGGNVTFSTNGAGFVQASAPAGGGGGVAISAGTNSTSTGTVVFSNSNNMSFGMSPAGVVTGTATFAQTTQPAVRSLNGSTGDISLNVGSSLSASTNGSSITFGLASNITTALQSAGAYLTTAMQSNAVTLSNIRVSGGTTSNLLSAITFANANGVSFGMNAGTMTASVAAAGGAQTGISSVVASNATYTSGQISFADGNGVSFGTGVGQAISITHGLQFTSNTSNITSNALATNAARVQSVNGSSGAISLNVGSSLSASTNGSSITFGLASNITTALQSAGAYLTTAMQSNAVTLSNIRVSGGTTSNLLSAITFADGNGVSFGMNAGTLTASVAAAGGAQTGISGMQVSNTTYTSGTVTFQNANGISFGSSGANGISASYTVPTVPTAYVSSVNGSSGAISLNVGSSLSASTNGSSITFGLASNITTALQSAGAYLTTAMQSNAVTLSNIRVSGGTTSNLLSAITFADGNGVSFGMNAGTLTASVAAAGGAQTGISGLVVSNTTYTSGTVTFQNANGISFGSSGANGISASYTVPVQTTQSGVTTAGNNIGLSGTLNQNGLSLSATVAAQTVQPGIQSIVVSNTTYTTGQVSFSNANGISFGSSAGGAITASYTVPTQSVQTQNSVLVQGSSGAISFANGNGITFGGNASTVTASHNGLTTQSNQNITAGNGGFAFQTLSFSNANGVSFSTSAGSAIVASHNGLTSQSNQTGNLYVTANSTQLSSSAGIDLRSLSFAGAGIASVGVSNGVVLVSVPSGGGGGDGYNIVQAGTTGTTGTTFSSLSGTVFINGGTNITVSQNASNQIVINAAQGGIAAGTQTATSGTLVFANSNGVTFGMSGSSQITASVAGGGGGATVDHWQNFPQMLTAAAVHPAALRQSTSIGFAAVIPYYLSVNQMRMLRSCSQGTTQVATVANTSWGFTQNETHNFVFYSQGAGASSLSLQSFTSTSVGLSMSVQGSVGAASNNLTVRHTYDVPSATGTIQFTASTAPAGSVSLPFNSTHLSNFISGIRMWATTANFSFAPDEYWVVHGVSSAGTTGGATAASALTAATFACSALVSIGVNSNIASFGTSAQSFNHAFANLAGSFTTAGGGTTGSLNITQISSWASNAVPYFYMDRIT